jgi:hypothetical protein
LQQHSDRFGALGSSHEPEAQRSEESVVLRSSTEENPDQVFSKADINQAWTTASDDARK